MSSKKKKTAAEGLQSQLARHLKHNVEFAAAVVQPEPDDGDEDDLTLMAPLQQPVTIAAGELDDFSMMMDMPCPVSPTDSESMEGFDDIVLAHVHNALTKPSTSTQPKNVTQRFKDWLGVNPGAHVAELEQTVRKQNPKASEYEVRTQAEVLARKEEKQKKSVHEKFISDEKICRMLLRSYFDTRDGEALAIYLQFQREHIARECGNDEKRAARRLRDIERAVATCDKQLTSKQQNVENVVGCMTDRFTAKRNDVVVIEDVRQSLLASTTNTRGGVEADGTLQKMYDAQNNVTAGTMPSAVRTTVQFVSAYTEDISRTPEQVQKTHLEGLSNALVSALNLTAALVEAAPDDALFHMGANVDDVDASNHPVSAMHKILRNALPDEPIDESLLTRFMQQWMRTQQESTSDVDRALVHVHQMQELKIVERELEKRGVSHDEVQAALAYGIDPLQSHMMRAVCRFVDNKEFEQAHNEAIRRTKLAQRYETHDRKTKRSYAATVDGDEEEAEEEAPVPPVNDYNIENSGLSFADFYGESARQLQMCSRAYLCKYMRAPLGGSSAERECANGLKCVCLTLSTPYPALGSNLGGFATQNVSGSGAIGIGNSLERDTSNAIPDVGRSCDDPPTPVQPSIVGRHQQGFVCREFLLPSQEVLLMSSKKLPDAHQVCLLCNRYATTYLYHQYTQQHGAGDPRVPLDLIQNHSVIIDQAGEYDHSACLLTTFRERYFTGIVKPFVGFAASHYRYSTVQESGRFLPCVMETAALDFRLASANATRT